MSTERQASQRGSERGVEMQSVGLGRHDRGGGVGRQVGGWRIWEERRSKLPCSCLLWLPWTVLREVLPNRSDVLRIYSMLWWQKNGCVQQSTSEGMTVCVSLVYLWQCQVSHCKILYTPTSTSVGAKAGIVLKVAGGARDSEKNACWLRLRQFNQGPATATSSG